jgi:hypothetical protein
MALELAQPLREMNKKLIFLNNKVRPAPKDDNLTGIYEPIV